MTPGTFGAGATVGQAFERFDVRLGGGKHEADATRGERQRVEILSRLGERGVREFKGRIVL